MISAVSLLVAVLIIIGYMIIFDLIDEKISRWK